MTPIIDRILIPRDRIAARITEMGRQITADITKSIAAEAPAPFAREPRVVFVPVLTGALVLAADLIRAMPLKMSIRAVTVSSYPGTATTSQGANIHGELPTDLKGAHVVLVDDILDSGRTLGLLRRMIAAQHPASLRIAVLLTKNKPGGREEDVTVEYSGFDIEDEFVVGYGLDYDGYFRNLPEVVTLKPA